MLPPVALADSEQNAIEQQPQAAAVVTEITQDLAQAETALPEEAAAATLEIQDAEDSSDSATTETANERDATTTDVVVETTGSDQSAAGINESASSVETLSEPSDLQAAKSSADIVSASSDSDSQDTELLTGEQYIDGHWYYYDESGNPVTGWHTWADGARSYFGTDGAALSGLQVVDGKTYYFDPEDGCHSVCGEQAINGKRYLFDDSYVMVVNWHKWSDGSWSYSNPDGVAHEGWLLLNKKWYYLDLSTLRAVANGERKVGSKTYGFDDTCAMLTVGWHKWPNGWTYADKDGAEHAGWLLLNKKWYYLDPSTLRAVANGEKVVKGKTYGFDKNCVMLTGWHKWADGWTYAGSDGAEKSGWQKINKKWYYLIPETLRAATNQRTVKGKLYYFDPSCAMISGWHKWSNGWSWSGTDGAVRSGWQHVKGAWYYLNPTTLRALTGEQTIDGKQYYFYGSCAMATGAVKHTGVVRLYGSDGALITTEGFSKVNGYSYYLVNLTPLIGDQTIDGKEYYFDSSYRMYVGWINRNGTWIFYGNDGAKTEGPAGWFVSNGTYYFNSPSKVVSTWKKVVYDTWQRIKNMSSGTQYLGSVCLGSTYVSFFQKQGSIWVPIRSFLCTIGANHRGKSLTPTGTYRTTGRKALRSSYDTETGYYEMYWTEIIAQKKGMGGLGRSFHSIPMYNWTTRKARGRQGMLGQRISSGCVRLGDSDVKWVYYNVKKGTTIHIF